MGSPIDKKVAILAPTIAKSFQTINQQVEEKYMMVKISKYLISPFNLL